MNNILYKASRYSLYLYIIIFTVTTSVIINRICLAVTFFFCGMSYIFNDRFSIKKNFFLIGMFYYGIMLYVSKFYAISPATKVSSVVQSYFVTLILILFIINNIKTEKDVKFYLHAFIVATIVQCIYMLYVYGVNVFEVIANSETAIRIGDEVSNSNSVGMSFSLGAIMALHFILNEKNTFMKKMFYLSVIAIGFVFGLLSGSRKALLILLIGLLFIMFFRSTNKKNFIKAFFGIIFSVTTVFLVFNFIRNYELFEVINSRFDSFIDGILGRGTLDHSSKARFEMIDSGIEVFLKHPIIGQGVFSSYYYFRTYSHNNFVEVLMNTGIIGFILFYYAYVVMAYKFYKINKKDKFFGLFLFLYLWLLFGAVAMVTYYDKYKNVLLAIISCWLYFKEVERYNAKNNN